MSDDKKEFAPSMIIGEVKQNKKGGTYFMWGQLYCEVFTAKSGVKYVRGTILPRDENYKKPDAASSNEPSF